MRHRLTEIRMLHICLNDRRYTWSDIWYILTGRV